VLLYNKLKKMLGKHNFWMNFLLFPGRYVHRYEFANFIVCPFM